MFDRVFVPPGNYGFQRNQINGFLTFMGKIRDYDLYEYPVLPGAVSVFRSIVTGREAKISANTASAAQRAADWLNEAQSPTYVGLIEYGLESFLRRRSLDYLVLGRTLFLKTPGKPLVYLDPVYVRYNFDKTGGYWQDTYTGERYSVDEVVVDHPLPKGGSGLFSSAVYPLLPTAMLSWLVREHDSASADGRKIRDIILVGSRELGETLQQAIKDSLAAWAGASADSGNVPLAWVDRAVDSGIKMDDYVTRLSLANVPTGFPRDTFEFNFANEISANLGVALRHFYNSERATNRALEEVQEARQQQKGPNLYTRTEERLLNRDGVINRFGRSVKFGFVEMADQATQKAKGEVLKAYADALVAFAKVFDGRVNGQALLAWLQNEDILPVDLELITEIGSVVKTDTPSLNSQVVETNPSADLVRASVEKDLPYDYVSVSLDGKILETRRRVFSIEKAIEAEIEPEINVLLTPPPRNFFSALDLARQNNYNKVIALKEKFIDYLILLNKPPVDLNSFEGLTDDHHRLIFEFLNENR